MRQIFITSDIGGNDADDIQSFIHALLYSNTVDIVGVACGWPHGNRAAAQKVVNIYSKDYAKLGPLGYPTASKLSARLSQGATAPFKKGTISPGARALIRAAADCEDKLFVTCWGSPTELAEALSVEPNVIIENCFCFVSGDWNRLQDEKAYNFVAAHDELEWISCMSTHRGMYLTGINGQKKYGNVGFVKQVIKPAGNLGAYFYKISENININKFGLKMGDTPSFLWAMTGNPDDPTKSSWGGRYRRITPRHWRDRLDNGLGIYPGAGTVAKHRRAILEDFERRLKVLYA